MTDEQRNTMLDQLGEQRWKDFENGTPAAPMAFPEEPQTSIPEGLDPITSEFFEYYGMERGWHPNTRPNFTLTSRMDFMNFPLLNHIESISPRPILFIMGENAHSRYFTEDAYEMAAEPKELYIVPGARHIDLYDDVNLIPFDKLESFFTENLMKSGSEGNTLEKDYALTQRQQSIILIAAFTAEGDLNRLKPALIQGLDAGLTINEINEVLVHLYAYTGFPRSLNGLFTFMQVLGERKAQGIEDAQGKEASPVPADLDRDAYGAKVRAGLSGLDTVPPPGQWQLFAPVMDGFLKQHLFADLFVRDVISHQDRELTTIAALANMTGTEGQLGYHLGAAMNTGFTQEQMEDFIAVLRTEVGNAQAESAQKLLTRVLER
jgi:alkylhydroperoxidase/carboxymuconolactone decarboxylase family protein YurZ